jgi:hypothetical protein
MKNSTAASFPDTVILVFDSDGREEKFKNFDFVRKEFGNLSTSSQQFKCENTIIFKKRNKNNLLAALV